MTEQKFRDALRKKMLDSPESGYEWVCEFRDAIFLQQVYVSRQTLVRPETSGYRFYGGVVEFVFKPDMKAEFIIMEKKDDYVMPTYLPVLE